MYKYVLVFGALMATGLASVDCPAQGDTETQQDPIVVNIADDSIQFSAPGKWQKIQPRSKMLEVEFAIPKVGDDPKNGRLTMMRAGGSVAANVDRWIGQFKNADGTAVKGIEPTTSNVAGQTVHIVDISGTFAESMGGPMGPKTDMPNYRMLGTIIETKDHGTYFVKFYGPKPTIDANADEFKNMIMGMKAVGTETAAAKPIVFTVADGGIQFTAPGNWKKVKPRSNMLEAEFEIAKVGDDENNGRLTIMGAGGSINANIDRWIGQFTNADGSPLADVETTTSEIAGQKVHMVDLYGTFADGMGGPVGPKTDREDYRMLGAIIETEIDGKYFVKFYGPKKTVDENAAAFKKMLQSLKVDD